MAQEDSCLELVGFWRALEIEKWIEILELNFEASQVGQQLAECMQAPFPHERALAMLEDVFAAKASNTLTTRSCAIFLFLKWYQSQNTGNSPALPVKEEILYDYFCHLRVMGAAPTRASSMMQAWNFCVHALGFEDPTGAAKSIRCAGSAHRQFLGKRSLQQKQALSMCMLAMLELYAVHGQDLWHQDVCWFLLSVGFRSSSLQ